MSRTRILVVDDSALVRKLVVDLLSSEPDFEVTGTASNGRIALARIRECRPDLITLDVEMPEMDGLQTLKILRETQPSIPVLMLSSLTERGASATLDSLLLGARDYVAKPSGLVPWGEATRALRDELIQKIRALRSRERRPSAPALPAGRPAPARAPRALVVGASTGGPNALAQLLTGMPSAPPFSVLIVQHMPPIFTRMLADRLSDRSGLDVREAEDGEPLRAGVVRVAPGGLHLEVVPSLPAPRLRVHQGMPENSCRPSVDVLFRSAAMTLGAGALGIVLTGMGQDGLLGCEALREAGARVLAQDEASSVVWGMPGAVVRAGLADGVLTPEQLRDEVLRRASLPGDRRG
jgi:two-component system, chemotaxis family, protein-glutamate methylesterase/glutaminase